MRATAYRTLNYERTNKDKQTSRSDCVRKIDIAPFVARIDAEIFCARKEMAVHHRSGALRGDRRDLGLADLRSGGCAGEVSLRKTARRRTAYFFGAFLSGGVSVTLYILDSRKVSLFLKALHPARRSAMIATEREMLFTEPSFDGVRLYGNR
jgi:hypothetical protein